MADNNPANFANLPKGKVQEIASMGGKASHGTNNNEENTTSADTEGRNEDGTFVKGSAEAKAAGHKGGLAAAGKNENDDPGRRNDGTFLPGSDAAKEAGHKGGVAAAAAADN